MSVIRQSSASPDTMDDAVDDVERVLALGDVLSEPHVEDERDESATGL